MNFVLPLLESDLLVVERGKVVPFDALPDRSIALDGYVQGPRIDAARMRFSFDHHDGCIRHVTRATCAQVWDALRAGLRADGMRVYVNDVDADTVVATWLLARDAHTPIRNQSLGFLQAIDDMVEAVATRDALGPAVFGYDKFLADRVFLDLMAPRNAHKNAGTYDTCDLRELLEHCVLRLDEWGGYGFDDRAMSRLPMVPRGGTCLVEIAKTVDGVTLARAEEQGAFERLYGAGHDRCVVYSVMADGTRKYTIGKRSEFVDRFPVGPASDPTTILGRLAAIEPGWGGGTTIGGSPRHANGTHSRLHPNDVLRVVLEACGMSVEAAALAVGGE